MSFDAGDLHFDLSKNLITRRPFSCWQTWTPGLEQRIQDQYHGVHINNTEDRAVLHPLRRPESDEGKFVVNGQDTVKDVLREVLNRIYDFARKVRSGGQALPAGVSPLYQHWHRRVRPGPQHGVRSAEALCGRGHRWARL